MMKPGYPAWFLIITLCGLGAFVIYRQSASNERRSGTAADLAAPAGGALRGSNGLPPATSLAGSTTPTKADGIERSASREETSGPSLKDIERMRKLAIAHSTPASQYISEMFDAKSARADIAATVLHGDLSKGKPDPAWSTASEATLRSEMAQLPSNFSNRLEFSQVKCGPSLCELQAATRFTSPYQSSQDIHDWQAYVHDMLRSRSSQADQLTDPVMILSTTPDDRPLFLVYFHRGQSDGSNSAGH